MKKYSKFLRISAFLASLCAAGTALAAGPNLVTNGGFADGLTGWSEINPGAHYGAVDYQNRYLDNPCGGVSVAGSNGCGGDNYGLSVLQGKYASDKADNTEGLKQTIAGLVVGHEYTLRFSTTGSDFIWVGQNVYWQVSFGSDTQDGVLWNVSGGDKNYLWDRNWNRTSADGDSINANFRWVSSALTFTATAATQVLKFQQKTSLDSAWDTSVTPYATPSALLLDGITLTDNNYTAPVPEPSTAGLGLAGITLLGFVISRRRRRNKA